MFERIWHPKHLPIHWGVHATRVPIKKTDYITVTPNECHGVLNPWQLNCSFNRFCFSAIKRNIKRNSKTPCYWAFVRGIHWSPWRHHDYIWADTGLYLYNTSLKPEQNSRHFVDDIFIYILNDDFGVLIQISLNCVPVGPTDNMVTLIYGIVRCRTGDKHYSNERWPRSLVLYGFNAPMYVLLIHKLRFYLFQKEINGNIPPLRCGWK